MNVLRSLRGLVLLAGVLTTRAAAQTDTVRVSGDRVNLRSAPSVDSSVVRSMAKGTLVTVVMRDNGWSKVKTGTSTGWVRSNLLTASVVGTGTSQSVAAPTSSTASTMAPASRVSTPPPAPSGSTGSTAPATSRRAAPPAPSSSSSAPAPKAMSTTSSGKDGVRFSIFGGITLKQQDETGNTIVGGFSLLFPVARMVSIGPEITGFYDSYTADADNSFKSVAASAALMIRVHSAGHIRVYGEAGPAAVSDIVEVDKFEGVSTTTTGVHLQGALALGAGVQLGPLVLGFHYHAHLATGGGHLMYITAGLSF